MVELLGAYLHDSKLWLLLELCEGGALDDVLLGGVTRFSMLLTAPCDFSSQPPLSRLYTSS